MWSIAPAHSELIVLARSPAPLFAARRQPKADAGSQRSRAVAARRGGVRRRAPVAEVSAPQLNPSVSAHISALTLPPRLDSPGVEGKRAPAAVYLPAARRQMQGASAWPLPKCLRAFEKGDGRAASARQQLRLALAPRARESTAGARGANAHKTLFPRMKPATQKRRARDKVSEMSVPSQGF